MFTMTPAVEWLEQSYDREFSNLAARELLRPVFQEMGLKVVRYGGERRSPGPMFGIKNDVFIGNPGGDSASWPEPHPIHDVEEVAW